MRGKKDKRPVSLVKESSLKNKIRGFNNNEFEVNKDEFKVSICSVDFVNGVCICI